MLRVFLSVHNVYGRTTQSVENGATDREIAALSPSLLCVAVSRVHLIY